MPDIRTAKEIEQERIITERLEKKRKHGRETARRAATKKQTAQIDSLKKAENKDHKIA